jgi:hypothetical protein
MFTHELPVSFFQFNIIQLLTPFMQLLIAIGLALFVNIKLSNSNKRNEIIIDLIKDYSEEFSKLHAKAIKYMENKESSLEPKILLLITSTSQKLSVIEDIKKEYNMKSYYSADAMRKDHMEYKTRLTDKYFKQHDEYPLMQKKTVMSAKNDIFKKIAKEKVSLYSK